MFFFFYELRCFTAILADLFVENAVRIIIFSLERCVLWMVFGFYEKVTNFLGVRG